MTFCGKAISMNNAYTDCKLHSLVSSPSFFPRKIFASVEKPTVKPEMLEVVKLKIKSKSMEQMFYLVLFVIVE